MPLINGSSLPGSQDGDVFHMFNEDGGPDTETMHVNNTASNLAKNDSGPLDMSRLEGDIQAVFSGFDRTLWIVGRGLELALLLVVIAVIYYFRKKIKSVLGPHLSICFDACRCRRVRRCVPYVLNLVPCLRHCAGKLGCNTLSHANNLLVITLIGASDIKSQLDFYVEVWSEPKEAAPKASRSHYHAVGRVDLGCERMEIDWYGDEEDVVVQVVKLGSNGGRDKVFTSTKIPVKDIHKYAQEAEGKQVDFKRGARLFEMFEPEKDGDKQPDPISLMIVQKVQNAMGVQSADTQKELTRLKEENNRLQTQLTQLTQNNSNFAAEQNKKNVPMMCMAMRFELISKSATTFDPHNFYVAGAEQSRHYNPLKAEDVES